MGRIWVLGIPVGLSQAVLPALLLGGCKVGPNYARPEPSVPDAWTQSAQADLRAGAAPLQEYWDQFSDPVLVELIRRASQGNLNLKLAAARIDEARALRGVSRAPLLPSVAGTADAALTRASEEITPTLPPGIDREAEFYSVGGAVAWELDLWGRIRRGVESASASLEATVEDYRDTLVVYYAEVAGAYVNIRTLQERIQYARKNARSQAETLQLTLDLNEAGLVSDLDVNQARLNLKRTESTIPQLETALAKTIHLLNTLLGDAPGTVDALIEIPGQIPIPPDTVQIGIPADLLRNRPDVRRAERQLAAQSAQIGVAKANLYPALYLPGTLTLEAFDPGNLNGGSLAYAFGPSVRWKLFSGGQVRNQIRAEEARTSQSLHLYELSILQALQEVEDAMVAFLKEKDRLGYLQESRTAATNSVRLVKDLYVDGLTQFQNVLDMERSLFIEEDQLTQSRGLIAQSAVMIYKALGGGWDLPEPLLGPAMEDPDLTRDPAPPDAALASPPSTP